MKKGRNEKRFLKRMAALVLALLVLATSIGICPQEVAAAKTPKNGIVFEQSKATLYAGEYTTIVPKEVYQNGKRMSWATPGKPLDKKEFSYKSSNTKVATVSSKGVVTAKKKGTATITVTSGVNKKVTAKFKVTVKTPDVIDTDYSPKGKAKIVLQETKVTLAPEKSFAGWYSEDGPYFAITEFSPNDGLGKYETPAKIMIANKKKYGTAQIKIKSMTGLKSTAVTYKSSNTKVAAVDSMGKVTPKRAGTAVITVTSKANKKVTATYKVTVKNLVTSFEFAQYTNLKYKEPVLEAPSISYMYDWRIVGVYPIPEKTDKRGYTLTSSDESIIKVLDNNEVAGVGYGTATLTLKSADGFCKYSWKCTVSDKGTTCWGNVDFGD